MWAENMFLLCFVTLVVYWMYILPQRPINSTAVVSCVVEQLWGVQDSIGVVPGQDPDLTAPAPGVACVREVSIQLQPKTKGGKRSSKILVRMLENFNVYQVPGIYLFTALLSGPARRGF